VHPTGNADLDALLSNTPTSEIQLNYIDIPVLLKYYPIQKLNIGLGPYFSFLTSGDNFYETDGGEAGNLQILQEIKSDFNTFDYGFMLEVVYAPWRKSNSDELNFHARFSYGLTDIIKNNPGDPVSNYAFQLFVSVPFMKTEGEE
jgi:outer membrane immunogenic protein